MVIMMMTRGDDDLDKLEQEVKRNAKKQVAAMLQRPDQLDKVENLQKKQMRKKAAADALLKSAVQSQLDGVKSGLGQLRECLEDIKVVKENFKDVHSTYDSVSGLKDKLVDLSEENTNHSKLASAVGSLKHIANVPENVEKTMACIKEGKLLFAHRYLVDLEASRDQLMLELHRQGQQNDQDARVLKGYFSEVENLSVDLSKQLWLSIGRILTTVRKHPTLIATALRIIDREHRLDNDWEKRYEQYGYKPADRPKRWREKLFDKLSDDIEARVEGNTPDNKKTEHKWLVRHLELIRRNAIEDLKVVKNLCEPCFPPEYQIVKRYVKLYHTAISQNIINLDLQTGLEGKEIAFLLTWCSAYFGPDMMGHPELDFQEEDLGPLLSNDDIEDLETKYIKTLRSNIAEWLSNAIATDKKEWYSEREPESDGKGYFITQIPVLLFQIVEQNLQEAQIVGSSVTPKVLDLCLDEISQFAITYSGELQLYKENHLKDCSKPRFYLQYMVSNINNCDTLSERTKQLKKKYSDEVGEIPVFSERQVDRYASIIAQFNKVSQEGCIYLKEEVFHDLGQFLNNILTRQWLNSENDVGTICATVEDYCEDFHHLRQGYFDHLLLIISEQILISYLRQLLSPSRKITFKSPEERKLAADKIKQESEQLSLTFSKLFSGNMAPPNDSDTVLPALAELLSMSDTSMMSLELSTLMSNFPDLKQDHLINLLLLREDMNKTGANQVVSEIMADKRSQEKSVKKSILSKV